MNVDKCTHLLEDLTYNDREDLCDQLDNAENGDIVDLIKTLLSVEEFREIWSSCRGGCDPPMNLLFHLSGKDNCTLAELRGYARDAGEDRFKTLIKLIDSHKDHYNTRLDNLDFRLLTQISELIRSKPYPTTETTKPLWKRLASTAGLSDLCITNLDVRGSRDPGSLTKAFITHINHVYPDATVAWLANGLKDINRRNILLNKDLQLFTKCKSKECRCIVDT